MKNQNEIALLRERIDQEVSALQRLKHGFASIASHELITRRYEVLGGCFEALAVHIGEQAAIETISNKLDQLL